MDGNSFSANCCRHYSVVGAIYCDSGYFYFRQSSFAPALDVACGNSSLVDRNGDVSIARRVAVGPICKSNAVAPSHEFVGVCRGVAGAARPVAGDFILNLGPGFAFAIGSFVLLGAVAFLRSVNPDAALSELPPDTAISERVSITALGLVAVMGMAVAWGSRAMGERILPHVFQTQIAGVDSKLLMAGFSLAVAFASLLAGVIAVRLGNQRTLLGGLVATAVLLLIMVFSQGFVMVVATVLAVIFTNSLIITAVVPFALSLVPPPRGGLGVGFYFGGFSLGMTFYSVVFVAPKVVPAGTTAIVGAIPYGIAALHAFLLAGVCVVAGDRLK